MWGPVYRTGILNTRQSLVVFVVFLTLVCFIGKALLSVLGQYRICADSNPVCLRDRFSDIVLVIVFNYNLYSSIPALSELYQPAFPTLMFCGPESTSNYTVEAMYINKGYYAYVCMSRAMEKYPGYHGYLLINDDVILNYWNLVHMEKDKIWEGPKAAVRFHDYGPAKRWYWWNSTWGIKTCQKAFNEIWGLQGLPTYSEWFSHNVFVKERDSRNGWLKFKGLLNVLAKNGNGKFHCYRGRSDIFYIPGKFADAFQTLSYIFYKHGTFLEIAVPTMCRILDIVDNFRCLSGIYLPGRAGDPPVRNAKYFWQVYNKSQAFIHPLKLSYEKDGALNKALLRSWITEYSNSLTNC